MNEKSLYSLQRTDFDKAKEVLFEAFLKDPFFTYMLGPRRSDARLAKAIHTFLLNLGTIYGEAYAPSADIEGVALWLPPKNARITAWKSLRSGVLNLLKMLPEYYKGALSFSNRMLAYASYSDRLHKSYASYQNWYLLAIGIADQHRGKGYASSLMRPMLERFNSERLACYLETHNSNNIELYRHFGFEVIGEGKLPGSEQKQWAMLRPPAI